jgi:hypothetical protein
MYNVMTINFKDQPWSEGKDEVPHHRLKAEHFDRLHHILAHKDLESCRLLNVFPMRKATIVG